MVGVDGKDVGRDRCREVGEGEYQGEGKGWQ